MARPRAIVAGGRARLLASAGFGLALLAMGSTRYSALWEVGGHDTAASLAIKVALTVAVGCAVAAASRAGRRGPLGPAFLALPLALGLMQLASVACRWAVGEGLLQDGPLAAAAISLSCGAYGVVMLYAVLFIRLGPQAAVPAFAAGTVLCGALQVGVALLPRMVSVAAVGLSSLAAAALLAAAWRAWGLDGAAGGQDAPDGGQAAAAGGAAMGAAGQAHLCATVLLAQFLIGTLHGTWLGVQDGGAVSDLVQLGAAVGTAAAGAALALVRPGVLSRTALESLWLVALPAVLLGFYLASLLDGAPLALVVVLLNMANVAILFLIFATPAAYAVRDKEGLCVLLLVCRSVGSRLSAVPALLGMGAGAQSLASACILAALLVSCAARFMASFSRDAQDARARRAAGRDAVLKAACEEVGDEVQLTPREREALYWLAKGRTAGHIAARLGITEATAKTHIMHVYQKLGVKSQQALMDVMDERMEAGAAGTR